MALYLIFVGTMAGGLWTVDRWGVLTAFSAALAVALAEVSLLGLILNLAVY